MNTWLMNKQKLDVYDKYCISIHKVNDNITEKLHNVKLELSFRVKETIL